jgi:IclR family pca regulon transcriptional regulator
VLASGLTVGTRVPAYLTSHGRIHLAALPDEQLDAYLARVTLRPRTAKTITDPATLRAKVVEARVRGWTLVDQELEEGVTSIAVPVHDPAGRVVATVNVGTQSRRLSPSALQRTALGPLRETAGYIERDIALLGVGPTPPAQL